MGYGAPVGEQTVERNDGRHGWEKRQQDKERRARCDLWNPMLRKMRVAPHQKTPQTRQSGRRKSSGRVSGQRCSFHLLLYERPLALWLALGTCTKFADSLAKKSLRSILELIFEAETGASLALVRLLILRRSDARVHGADGFKVFDHVDLDVGLCASADRLGWHQDRCSAPHIFLL